MGYRLSFLRNPVFHLYQAALRSTQLARKPSSASLDSLDSFLAFVTTQRGGQGHRASADNGMNAERRQLKNQFVYIIPGPACFKDKTTFHYFRDPHWGI